MINNEKQEFWRFDFSSSQIYKDTTNPNDSCGRPLATQFADRSVTGDAVYVGDIQMKDALHLAFVLSTVAHANIKSIDISEAKKVPGFVDFVDVHDVPALNQPGLLDFNMTDDNTPIFAAGKVECIGQIVGAVVCEDDKIARRTAKLVKIEYEPLDAILTMEKAIEAKSYLSNPFELGTPVEQIKKALQESDTVFEGETRGGPQEHLYMEPNCTVAVPGESNEWIIHCSTQSSGAVQHQIAAVLGIPANKVVMKVKRLGGGFGGKAFQAGYIAIATAVAAHKLKRPVSTVLSRKDDMAITGKRHPFISKYRVGLDKEKNIQAVDFETYFNAGWAHDVSKEVNMVYVSRSDQSFKFPHMRTWGVPLKTNTVSNTAFRGFGQPQAHFVIENMMLRVAHELGKEFEELCSSYFAKCGDINISGHTIRNDMLQSCWSECKKLSDFDKRKMDVDEFNRSSKSHKRGIAMTSCRFGMTHFGALEQGVALVQIYLDGSVALSIGGVEMGQGLNQKCIQIASRALGISADRITILDSSTDRTANAPETGGSIGADLHGLAVKNACEEILSRFAPLVKKYGSWDKAAGQAFLTERVSLRAVGYGTIDREKYNVGMEETYYTTGAACAEVEIDAATGEHKGYGYLTSEEMLFNDDGSLQTNSAYGYKIPTVPMTPAKFNVKLLEKGMNFPQQVYGSKGVGEPPLLLGFSVYAALHKAIMSRRKGLNHTEWIEMSAPLTAKKIVQFCNP
ncbi:hypothetical protein WR25_15164 [Diploscapter pachys]|uniref:Aldehyde oxidase/xanthine dehydrogenase a/b hammerhead domain-containing protein n=1 Tax=Diploscapter pachys TaxID=2018661 RepID=A0A2A2KP71_9BILA|nr:hypothetical protein WR25_15164 [Diploscapter pachys]